MNQKLGIKDYTEKHLESYVEKYRSARMHGKILLSLGISLIYQREIYHILRRDISKRTSAISGGEQMKKNVSLKTYVLTILSLSVILLATTRYIWANPGSEIAIVSHSFIKTASYVIENDDGTIKAFNGQTGALAYSGTDASTIIQSVLNQNPAKIHLKDLITLDATITINSPVIMQGEGMGTGFKIGDGLNIRGISATSIDYITFRDLEFDGNSAGRTGFIDTQFAHFFECNMITFDNCFVHNQPSGSISAAIFAESGSSPYEDESTIHIINCKSWENRYAFLLTSCIDSIIITGCWSRADAKWIHPLRAHGVNAVGNTVSDCPGIAVYYEYGYADEEDRGYSSITNNYFVNCTNVICVRHNNRDVLFADNVCLSCTNIISTTGQVRPWAILARGNIGLNPYGEISTPFSTTYNTTGLLGDTSTPAASTDYEVVSFDQFMSVTGGTGVDITIKDGDDNIIVSGLTALTAQFLPVGYKINFGAFSVAPTVKSFGN